MAAIRVRNERQKEGTGLLRRTKTFRKSQRTPEEAFIHTLEVFGPSETGFLKMMTGKNHIFSILWKQLFAAGKIIVLRQPSTKGPRIFALPGQEYLKNQY